MTCPALIKRPWAVVAWGFAIGLLGTVSWLCSGTRSAPRPVPARAAPSSGPLSSSAISGGPENPVLRVREPDRFHSSAQESLRWDRRIPTTSPIEKVETRYSRVRVRGQLLLGGQPCAQRALAFRPLGTGVREGEELGWVETDGSGRFEQSLPAGGFVVLDEQTGAFVDNLMLNGVAPDVTCLLEMPDQKLHGRVTGIDGSPLSGVRVQAVRLFSLSEAAAVMDLALMSPGGHIRTNHRGEYSLETLVPGDYLVTWKQRGSTTLVRRLTVHGKLAPVNATLDASVDWHGFVHDAAGHPLSMELLLWREDGPGLSQLLLGTRVRSTRDGTVVVPGLAPGRYHVVGFGENDRGDLALFETIELARGAKRFELAARFAGAVTATVRGPDGGPLRGATLDLRTLEGAPCVASQEWFEHGVTADDQGRIQLDDMIPGRYRIAATRHGCKGPDKQIHVRFGQRVNVDLRWGSADEFGSGDHCLPRKPTLLETHPAPRSPVGRREPLVE